mmetsp:Transcript_53732/g.151353  ORF Transcript_53732/g.151353 Transcript_53732/m.151353 type:complete len:264 (+) Transcript_53732:1817-2608(+)
MEQLLRVLRVGGHLQGYLLPQGFRRRVRLHLAVCLRLEARLPLEQTLDDLLDVPLLVERGLAADQGEEVQGRAAILVRYRGVDVHLEQPQHHLLLPLVDGVVDRVVVVDRLLAGGVPHCGSLLGVGALLRYCGGSLEVLDSSHHIVLADPRDQQLHRLEAAEAGRDVDRLELDVAGGDDVPRLRVDVRAALQHPPQVALVAVLRGPEDRVVEDGAARDGLVLVGENVLELEFHASSVRVLKQLLAPVPVRAIEVGGASSDQSA